MDVVLPKAGTYVVAVSGGVDSVVLLYLLSKQRGLKLVVAHFDHGIRDESVEDRKFVQSLADQCNLDFEYADGKLGKAASEAAAREARYKFLRGVMKKHEAAAILTAHHQDDVLETAVLNMLRGTGRKGLTSLKSSEDIKRPLLKMTKAEIVDYAHMHNLEWHEDPTNQDTNYQRNYVRHNIVPRIGSEQRAELVSILAGLEVTNKELDGLLISIVPIQGATLDRPWFNGLSHNVAREVMAAWLRQHGIGDFDRKMLERLVVAAKTGRPHSTADVLKGVKMQIDKNHLALVPPER